MVDKEKRVQVSHIPYGDAIVERFATNVDVALRGIHHDLDDAIAGLSACVVNAIHDEVCHILVVLGDIRRGLIQNSLEILF
jgi:hypothetical protein